MTEDRIFDGTIDDFKRIVAKSCQHADNPAIEMDALWQAHKLVGIAYLSMQGDKADLAIAATYLEYANRRLVDREIGEAMS